MNSITVAAVQFAPRFGKKAENFHRMEELVSGTRADVIVFPELCTTGYFFTSRDEVADVAEEASGATAEFFRAMARRHNAVVAAGFAEVDQRRLFNSCLVVVPEREEALVYRKTHLFYKDWNGKPLRQAGPRGDAVITADIQPAEARHKSFNPVNDVLRDRRPEHYGPIVAEDR